jgi:Golgi phosphoprotein 3 (GPP34)
MRTLGEDIVLLAIKPDGHLSVWDKLRFALAGSELVRLAAAGRVEIVDKRIVLVDAGPLDDPLLATALADIQRSTRPPRATDWVKRRGRQRLVDEYLARLTDAGVIRAERRKVMGLFATTRWYVLDIGRQADARWRLDAIARSSGPVDSAQAAFGGLVHAVQLDAVLYPGRDGKPARARLKKIARRDATANAVQSAATDASTRAASDAAIRASTDAAMRAATQAATQAATDAAIQASIDAAVSASITATHDAGGHGSAAGGHH